MFEKKELNQDLSLLIEKQNYTPVLALIEKNSLDVFAYLWFLDAYSKSNNPAHWLRFLEALLATQGQDDYQEKINSFITKIAIQIENKTEMESLIIWLLNQQKFQYSILKNLARTHKNNSFLIDVFKKTEPEEQKLIVYQSLIRLGIEKYNGALLNDLKQLEDPFDFFVNIKKLNLGESEFKKLERLLEFKKDKAIYVNDMMTTFIKDQPQITYKDALLTLAQIKERKKYHFEPVLLDNSVYSKSEFKDFLITISSIKKPIKIQFVCYRTHIVSGEIKIEEGGVVKIWFSDSIYGSVIGEALQGHLCKSLFYDFYDIFPKGELYIPFEKRQSVFGVCGIFALDDVQHSTRLHLHSKYKETGIWGYLDDSVQSRSAKILSLSVKEPQKSKLNTEISEKMTFKIYACPLPLSLLRTMQHQTLLDTIIPNRSVEEQEFPINKKGETAYDSSIKSFEKNHFGKLQNKRLHQQFIKMSQNNWRFLESRSIEEIEEKMNFFTLESFKKRTEESMCLDEKHVGISNDENKHVIENQIAQSNSTHDESILEDQHVLKIINN